jgi:3-hydroxyisobutyrate dehydrogenase
VPSPVGFIGLGNMGAALARRLAHQVPLLVFDLDARKVAELGKSGLPCAVHAATSPKEVAQECDTILFCLPTSEHVQRILFGEDPIADDLRSGTLLIDCTTGQPELTRSIAADLAGRGVAFVDAPVSGGPQGAEAGTIAILIGGSDPDFEAARVVLGLISPNVRHVGAVGAGHCVKLLNNVLAAGHRMLAFETAAIASANGVDPETFIEAVNVSSGRSYATEITMPRHVFGTDLVQGFGLQLMAKDVRLSAQLVPETMGEWSLVREVHRRLQDALAALPPGVDINETLVLYERGAHATVATSDRPSATAV